MKNQRSAVGFPVAAGLLTASALLFPACGGGSSDETSGPGGTGGTMDLVEASNGFGQLLPHTVLKIGANGLPTATIVPIRSNNDLIQNVTTSNPVRTVPQWPIGAVLPTNAPGSHFLYAEFTQPIRLDTVLSSSPGAQSNSGLTGSITLVALDPATGASTAIQARVFVNGFTYAGTPTGSPPVLPLQHWVENDATTGQPIALDVDGATPGLGFPTGFSGSHKLISPNTIVFVADNDGDLSTPDTFPAGREIKLRITTAVKSTGNKPLKRPALACSTVGIDTLKPEVATTPPPLNAAVISPGQGDTNVDPLTKIRIEFTEPIQPTAVGSLPTGAPPITSASVRVQFGPSASTVQVPFTVLPVSVFDLSTFELTPAYNFPGAGPANQPCGAFNTINVSVNPGLIVDLAGVPNVLGASTFFTTGEGPGLVNAPVTPDTIYIGRSGAVPGLSVIDLNGFGASTGDPDYEITNPAIEGNSNYPNNPNVKLQGGALFPQLAPGTCTVNGGSAGVFTLTKDSSLNDKLVRGPLVNSVDDVMLGHALDGSFNNGPSPFGCQSGGGNLCALDGLKVIAPVVNGNTMQPLPPTQAPTLIGYGAENLACWAPHPNPPPLQFPPLCVSPLIGGQEPTSVNSPANLLGPGDPFAHPAPPGSGLPSVPPAGLLSPEQNSFFRGPSPPAATIAGCTPFMMRQQIGHFMYVVDRARREVVILNSNRMTVIDRIQTQDPTSLAMSPNLNLLAVTNQLADLVSFIDIDPSSATFHHVVQATVVGNRPRGIAWVPDNEDILVCNEGENTMSILSGATLTVRRVVSSQLSEPFDVAITPRQVCWGFSRNVYFAYIINRNGRVAVFESGPSTVNGWGYDDVIGIASSTFRNPKAIQPDQTDLRSGVWIAHEGPIDLATDAAGPLGVGAMSKLVIESGVLGQIPLSSGSGFFTPPQFRDLFLGVQVSIGTPSISGVPVDIAFDNLRSYAGLPGFASNFTVGTPVAINGKQMVRGGCPAVFNNSEPRYMFVAVPSPVAGTGVVDVVRIDQGFTRIDTNTFQSGIQSIPATNCQVVADYYRQ